MIIQFPNVVFRWHNNKHGICGIEDYITDFEKGNYGYIEKIVRSTFV